MAGSQELTAHGSSESQVALKINDNYRSIADWGVMWKMFFIKIGRWPFSKITFLCETHNIFRHRPGAALG